MRPRTCGWSHPRPSRSSAAAWAPRSTPRGYAAPVPPDRPCAQCVAQGCLLLVGAPGYRRCAVSECVCISICLQTNARTVQSWADRNVRHVCARSALQQRHRHGGPSARLHLRCDHGACVHCHRLPGCASVFVYARVRVNVYMCMCICSSATVQVRPCLCRGAAAVRRVNAVGRGRAHCRHARALSGGQPAGRRGAHCSSSSSRVAATSRLPICCTFVCCA